MRTANAFGGVFKDRRVLVTGHTGFKGSWLVLWLRHLGANVAGFSLDPPTEPAHYPNLKLDLSDFRGNINDASALNAAVASFQPEVVFHLAAQPIVRESYRHPAETFATNVVGTVNVYEACRNIGTVSAIVSITTDKVYENREWEWGYRENDPLGGYDPYSASKACAEIASASYRNSFWLLKDYGSRHNTLLATARAGNVVGGGDWARDRIIPDLVRGAAAGVVTTVRSPNAIRPWQHVLEPLCGYLMLAKRLLGRDTQVATAWNFGPEASGVMTVHDVVERMRRAWADVRVEYRADPNAPHEAKNLQLDSSRARAQLRWGPVWDPSETIERTVEWYKAFYASGELLSEAQIERFTRDAREKGLDGV